MYIMPEDFPYKVNHAIQDAKPYHAWIWNHVGQQGIDWDREVGVWLFARESDAVAFVTTWL